MIHPIRDWDRFFFQPQTAKVLGFYRIVIGFVTLYSLVLFAKDVSVFFSDAGLLTVDTLEKARERDWHSILRWIRSPLGVGLVFGLTVVAAALFTVGYRTRISSVALFLLVASFHERNTLVLNSGDSVLRTILFFFMFAPAGAAFSVDSLIRRVKSAPGVPPQDLLAVPWAQRMMQLQVAVIYFITAYAKTRGSTWHDGSAMYYVFGAIDYNVRGIEQLMNYPILCSTLTFIVLFVEIAIPFLLWFRATRPYAVFMGILLHGWIILFMTIPIFGILMIATYIPFFSEEEQSTAATWLRRRFGHLALWKKLESMPGELSRKRWFLWLAGKRALSPWGLQAVAHQSGESNEVSP